MFTMTEPGRIMHWDDLTGEALHGEEVRTARKLEFEPFTQLGIYGKVPVQSARDEGHKTLGLRWVGTKVASCTNRPRLVSKTTNTNYAPELFAATPPIVAQLPPQESGQRPSPYIVMTALTPLPTPCVADMYNCHRRTTRRRRSTSAASE